jgi:antitoxin CcdA
MNHTHIKSAPKRPVNLTVDANLLKEAKELDIQLSSEFENLLERLVAEKKREIWHNEVQDSIETYSAYVEKNGTFSDGLREF